MKRITILFVILTLTLLAGTATAQDAVKTGAKGGLNFATISSGDFDTRTGFVIGGFAKFGIPDSPLSIQPEALYSQQDGGTGGLFGGSSNIENQTEDVDYGFAFGGGLDIEVGDSIFTMDARYNLGKADVFTDQSGKNRVFSITFGISLPSGTTN